MGEIERKGTRQKTKLDKRLLRAREDKEHHRCRESDLRFLQIQPVVVGLNARLQVWNLIHLVRKEEENFRSDV